MSKNSLSFHLLFRAMSRDLHFHPVFLSSMSLSSTSPSFTGSGSRLITSRIHCADSRGLRGDGFSDPEPRTGLDTKHKFEVSDTLSADLETVATGATNARWHQMVLDGDVAVSRWDSHRETQEPFYVKHKNMST